MASKAWVVYALKCVVQILAGTVLAMTAGFAAEARDDAVRPAQWMEAAKRQAAEVQRRQRAARLRWDYERRRSGAHARMPNTLYASTPERKVVDLSCPVPVDEGARRIWRRHLDDDATLGVLDARSAISPQSRNSAVNVFAAGRHGGPTSRSSSIATRSAVAGHGVQAGGWTMGGSGSTTATAQHVYLFPSASEPLRQGFVRVVNHSGEAGDVRIEPVDDSGRTFDALTLSMDADATVHFNSGDLEIGNVGKGLTGHTGSGQGDWRLTFTSDLDIEVLAYIRTRDGFLTAMHDVAPAEGNVRRVAIFNPGSNRNQVSRLRLVNPGAEMARVTIRGTDDRGVPGTGAVSLSMDAGTAREITAAQLESGAAGLDGMLGDGSGKWRLEVESEQEIVALSLLESPTDHLTNLSTVPAAPRDGLHRVPLFPAARDASGRQGFLRVVNRSAAAGEVRIEAFDESEWEYDPLTLSIGANEVVHFNSDDLEQGSPQKGLSGDTGAGEGDWRLQLVSDLDILVLGYIRTQDGFLTAMHDVVPSTGNTHRVAVFNPGSNRNQASLLRVVNPGDEAVGVTVSGIDGNGDSGAGKVGLFVPAGRSRTLAAWELEDGGEGLDGVLGDGAGKWELTVTSDAPVVAMSLLRSPTGHLMNLSTAPGRGARKGNPAAETAEDVFRESISPIVKSKCIACHVEGGASGNTRLVFVRAADDEDHAVTNLAVFEDFLAEVEDGAALILNKIQGVSHGGGIQVAAGSVEFADMERFLSLLGEDVGPVSITPDTLFDGVRMESGSSTLRRAAIVFAGRVPTEAEYESIRTGGWTSLRAAIRGLMDGQEFHEFLIRASNDRLLTDRHLDDVFVLDDTEGHFVDYVNSTYDIAETAYLATGNPYSKELQEWTSGVTYGVTRSPLELIAHVGGNDLSYTEILTADYVMANPWARVAYGAASALETAEDVHRFEPSEIVSYYRIDPDHRLEQNYDVQHWRVVNPGALKTSWPHAGVLNTKVFLRRYPTTATNRNRARSRWTYYHFLGVDIEKSAPRTTDPSALADANNPTLRNPACAVCHTVMDPVAGAYQNYGDTGNYRDQWGGLDSLDEHYKDGAVNGRGVRARSWAEREPVSWQVGFGAGRTTLGVTYTNDFYDEETGHEGRVYLDRLSVMDDRGDLVVRFEFEDLKPPYNEVGGHYCGGVRRNPDTGEEDHIDLWNGGRDCMYLVDLDVPADGTYEVEVVGWGERHELFGRDGMARIAVTENPYRTGDTWFRDMREPGFDGDSVPDPDTSLQWLAERIVGDERFARATVRFWWPAIMGSDVAEPPEDESDADFGGLLLASNAQSAEVTRLARAFRRGFRGGAEYNLKDLLVEMVTSRWFRAKSFSDDDRVRGVALRDAGARRLLTPEELARKTAALTGFQWGRRHDPAAPPHRQWQSRLTNKDEYRLLYGGIDSNGVTGRARDLTSVMTGVARSHAVESSCPVVLREFYLLPDEDRRLFGGIDTVVSPVWEDARGTFATPVTWGSVTLDANLTAGSKVVRLRIRNGNALVDELVVRDSHGAVVAGFEYEELAETGCGQPWPGIEPGYFAFWCGSVDATVHTPATGDYEIEVKVLGEPHGDVSPELSITVESADRSRSKGAAAIQAKLAELHGRLLGVEVRPDSPDVEAAYRLFVDVWERKRLTNDDWFFEPTVCSFDSDHLFFDGILDDAVTWQKNDGGRWLGYDYDRVWQFLNEEVDPRDPDAVARTWVVVLAALLMDHRYLYL